MCRSIARATTTRNHVPDGLPEIRGTEKLITLLDQDGPLWPWELYQRADAEVLILKDGEKKRINFTDSDATQAMRDNLRVINNALLSHWADLELPDNKFRRLGGWMIADEDRQPLDLSRRTLYRVFNNRSFEQGGRFYGGWWQEVPRVYRRFIRIDGEPTAELDYSSLHPRILYALRGYEWSVIRMTWDLIQGTETVSKRLSTLWSMRQAKSKSLISISMKGCRCLSPSFRSALKNGIRTSRICSTRVLG